MKDPRGTIDAIEALEAVLREAIGALAAGDFSFLQKHEREKIRLGAILEQKLAENPEIIGEDRLRDLKALIQRDADHLQQARRATIEIIEEVSRVRDRHGVSGLYGRSGVKRDMNATASRVVDKTF